MAHSATPIDDKRQSGEAAPEAPPRGRSVAHLRPGSKTWALNVLGIGAILAFCYFAEETLVVILVSILIAFILDPVAIFFTRLHLPRAVASGIAIFLLIALLGGLAYLGVNQVSGLLEELPRHSSEIRRDLSKFAGKAQKLEVLNPAPDKGAVKVRETPDWTALLSRGFGSVSQGILAASFIPFLVFFMLTGQEHARRATLGLVSPANRRAAYVSLGLSS